MRLTLCGVRGSTPAAGVEFIGVGGNTSCVAVTPIGAEVPSLVLDAGTGIRNVTRLLAGRPFRGTILLTHLHWDHVQGLPFFTAADCEDADVRLLVPDAGVMADEVLRRAMSPPHFPIGPEGLRGNWSFETLGEGSHDVEGLDVEAREIPHKGGRTFGYRLIDADGVAAYLPDHLPALEGAEREAALALAEGADVLIHDAQFGHDEIGLAREYGHSTVEQATALAADAGVGKLVLFHHAPFRTDGDLADLAGSLERALPPVHLGCEGDELVP